MTATMRDRPIARRPGSKLAWLLLLLAWGFTVPAVLVYLPVGPVAFTPDLADRDNWSDGRTASARTVNYHFRSTVNKLCAVNLSLTDGHAIDPSALSLTLREAGEDRVVRQSGVQALRMEDGRSLFWRFAPLIFTKNEKFVLTITVKDAGGPPFSNLRLLDRPPDPGGRLEIDGRRVSADLPLSLGYYSWLAWPARHPGLGLAFGCLLATLSFVPVLVVLFLGVWTNPGRLRRWAANLAMIVFTTLISFTMVDLTFHYWLVRSDVFSGLTLTGRRWLELNWHPVNSTGFRDKEHPAFKPADKKTVMVLGDSFAAGHGIERVEDRFTDILQAELGPGWLVLNKARNGWSTRDELETLRNLAWFPDQVIVAYYLNDIEASIRLHNLKKPPGWAPRPPVSGPARLANWSYGLNQLYWAVYRLRVATIDQNYLSWLVDSFNNEDVWRSHSEELEGIINLCRERGEGLLFVLFPHLVKVEETAPLTAKVARYLKEKGAKVIDLAPLVHRRPAKDLVVSSLDPHPGRRLHREVAAILADAMRPAAGTGNQTAN